MRVCLYLEGGKLLGKSGIGVALERQKAALSKAGVEYTTDPQGDYDIIHINTILPKSLFYAKAARANGKKVILHAHTLEEDTRNSFRFSNAVAPLFRRYLKYYYGHADHILCPSEYAKRTLQSYGVKVPMTAVSNGVDLDRFKFSDEKRKAYREKYKLDEKPGGGKWTGKSAMVPFSVGHVFPRKGVETFVSVARAFENKFVWFGNIYGKALVSSESMRRAIEGKPDNVTFTGFVDDIIAGYCAGDVFFFPSTAETQGIVILEAWAMGRPALIRDLPVYSDWTHEGVDCLRAKGDEDFKRLLKELISDESLRERLAKNGLKEVKSHSMEEVGRQLKKVYQEVLKGG